MIPFKSSKNGAKSTEEKETDQSAKRVQFKEPLCEVRVFYNPVDTNPYGIVGILKKRNLTVTDIGQGDCPIHDEDGLKVDTNPSTSTSENINIPDPPVDHISLQSPVDNFEADTKKKEDGEDLGELGGDPVESVVQSADIAKSTKDAAVIQDIHKRLSWRSPVAYDPIKKFVMPLIRHKNPSREIIRRSIHLGLKRIILNFI